VNPRLFTFVAGESGPWKIQEIRAVFGEGLAAAPSLDVVNGVPMGVVFPSWQLSGVTSHERYVNRAEKEQLVAVQPALGRPEATCAVLIPIRKHPRWWALTPDERRRIFEEQSHHTAIGLNHLPAVARRLHHCRDLGEAAAFDFLTWFEFAPDQAAGFDRLLAELRATPEWEYVEREVEVRVVRRTAL
jgi:chlorite dismutase